jgi:hypothetical protein
MVPTAMTYAGIADDVRESMCRYGVDKAWLGPDDAADLLNTAKAEFDERTVGNIAAVFATDCANNT